jgi:predicted ATPase/class 3 adenylate cyclase
MGEPGQARPSGTVTFLLSDVEGSTRQWAADPEAMSASLKVHDQLLREVIESRGGYVFTTAGDSFAAAFGRASDAVAAAQAAQAALGSASWPGPELRVRIGLHLGEAEERGDDYFGPVVNTAARVEAAGHGGQTLLTDHVRAAARVTGVRDLGTHELRDVDEPIRLFQLGEGEFPPLRVAVNAPPSNLPVRPTRLIGRTGEVAQVRRLLTQHRLVTITAVGGSGKTRVAIAVGDAELDHRPGGVWFVDLTAVMNADDVPSAVAGAVGLRLTGDDPTRQVVTYLADKAALVILDNCEHVIDACAEFAEIFLSAAGDAAVLATSREALGIEGEQVMHLPSLASTASDEPDGAPAVQLFVERARAIDPRFELDGGNTTTVATLCERLDGMPLAIELAAARITVMTPAELLEGLSDRFLLLSGGRRRQRQRTLEATLDWSYDLLEPEPQRVFRTLGVFVGGFDLNAAAAVASVTRLQAMDTLEALVAKSLVVHTEHQEVSRFALLETVKAYAEDRLVQTDDAAQVRERHAEHFHHLAMVRGRTLSADLRVGERLRHDRSNITSAFDWAASNQQWTTAGELLLGSLAAYDSYGYAAEARALFHRCEAPLDDADPQLADFLRALIRGTMVLLDDWIGAGRVVERLTASDDPRCRTIGYAHLGFVSAHVAPPSAGELFDQAARHLAIARAECPGLDTDIAHGFLLFMDGARLGYEGDHRAALASYDQIPDNHSRHDHVAGEDLQPHVDAAMCHLLLGEPAKALQRVAPLDGVAFAYGEGHEVRGPAHLALGDIDTARHHIRAHATEAATGRVSRQCNDAVLLLAGLAHAEGDDDTATDLLDQMGMGRTPATIMYANDLARRLGMADRHAANQRTHLHRRSHVEHGILGARTAMAALRAELSRRGWD